MNYVIFDIDNCIADDAWRIPFIDWMDGLNGDQRYAPYHARCGEDLSANRAPLLLWLEDCGTRVVFFTARPEDVRAQTEEWLYRQFKIVNPIVLMRRVAEFVPSVELKRQMLTRFRADLGVRDRIIAAYDDREDICDMYRSEGIGAHVLKIHDVCAYTNPATQEKHHG